MTSRRPALGGLNFRLHLLGDAELFNVSLKLTRRCPTRRVRVGIDFAASSVRLTASGVEMSVWARPCARRRPLKRCERRLGLATTLPDAITSLKGGARSAHRKVALHNLLLGAAARANVAFTL